MSVSVATPSVALVGNPNTGKTTLFNALTGLSQQVGNYPGVTVERAVGVMKRGRESVRVIDVPGTYSLAARSQDELVAVDVLLGQQAGESPLDAVVVIVDASNLPRNLYLTSQVLELGIPTVIALNMTDVAERRGHAIDVKALEDALGVPVIPVRADKRVGILALEDAILRAVSKEIPPRGRGPELPAPLLAEAESLRSYLHEKRAILGRDVSSTEALRALVDLDGEIPRRLLATLGDEFAQRLAAARARLGENRPCAALEAGARYAWANALRERAVRKQREDDRTFTRRVDGILTHRLWGTAVLFFVLAAVFQAIYRGAAPLMDLIGTGTDLLGSAIAGALAEGPLESLLVDGVVSGVGGVIVFLPQILLLFFFVALLEDCGYMARAAFLMDKLLTKIGLSGQSVIPLISSFACAVPGIMAARSISNRRDRLATILVAPLMSCSARLPVYVLMIGAFVPEKSFAGGLLGLQGLVLLAAHLIGLFVAIPVVWITRRTILRGALPAFVMELPDYKLPNSRTVATRLYAQGREFLLRAGSVILAFSIVVWALSYFPRSPEVAAEFTAKRAVATSAAEISALDEAEASAYLQQSVMGRLGHFVEPVVAPLGWDWRIGMAAIASFPAREVVIATMGTILGVGEDVDEESSDLIAMMKRATRSDGTPLFSLPVALSIVVFFALCCQCASTLVVIRRESGSWSWPALTFVYMTVLAYIGALVTYQVAVGIGA